MKEIFVCEKCGNRFEDSKECLEHEKKCVLQTVFICHKCGRVITWKHDDVNAIVKENQCHTIDLGKLGYGSVFDGATICIEICDYCLQDLINSLKLKEDVIKWS